MSSSGEYDGILHEGEREAHRRYSVRREANAMSRIILGRLTPSAARFVEAQPFFFIATASHHGECDCSFKGRNPPAPALKVMDGKTLVFPDYRGNNLFNSLGNIIVNPNIGMLFADFCKLSRLQINGTAEILEDSAAFRCIWPDAARFVKVTVRQVYPNCKARIPVLTIAAG